MNQPVIVRVTEGVPRFVEGPLAGLVMRQITLQDLLVRDLRTGKDLKGTIGDNFHPDDRVALCNAAYDDPESTVFYVTDGYEWHGGCVVTPNGVVWRVTDFDQAIQREVDAKNDLQAMTQAVFEKQMESVIGDGNVGFGLPPTK